MESQHGGVEAWEARAEHEVGLLIERYLRQNPSPAESLLSQQLAVSAQYLREAGDLNLAILALDGYGFYSGPDEDG
jgi:hypothetical protein